MSKHRFHIDVFRSLGIVSVAISLAQIELFAGAPSIEKLNLPEITTRTLLTWQAATGIAITRQAASAILNSVLESRTELNRLLLAQNEKSDPAVLTRNLIRHYCFNLRDSLKGLELNRAAQNSMFVQSFQARGDSAEITAGVVRTYPFLDFIKNLISSLSTTMEVGELDVASIPLPARIVIDSKFLGYTPRMFVVSTGSHDIFIGATKPCHYKVEVSANRKAPASCPIKAY